MLRSVVVVSMVLALACSTGQIGEAESGNANVSGPGVAATPDVGKADAGPTNSEVPTFAVDVEPIVQDKCQNCHRPDGVAPFSLITFDEVKNRGYDAKDKVTKRDMPPWGAFDTEDCKHEHKLMDDLRLTDDQISIISRWVDGGMPMGDESKRRPTRTSFPSASMEGSSAFKFAKPHVVQPGADDIRCFPIDPNFTEDTWVTGTNVVPGDPRVVHHVIVYLDRNKKAGAKAGDDGSYKCFGGPDLGDGGGGTTILLAWAPGVPPTGFGQSEAAIKVPKGSGLVMQVHYHPTNAPVTDQSSFEVRSLPPGQKPKHVAQVSLAGNAKDAEGSNTGGRVKLLPGPNDPASGPEFMIPSKAENHTESMDITPPTVPVTLRLAIVGAHMHWAGTNLKMKIERENPPAGQPKNECLLSAPKYDFNWQRGYAYDVPYEQLPTIAGGDKLHISCTYNNSTSNRHVQKALIEERAKEPFDLRLGETTRDEMCLGALVIVRDFVPGFD